MESPKLFSSHRCKNHTLTCARLQTTRSQVIQYRAENENLRKFGSTFSHGTVFTPKQCLYQKEATGIENQKMYSTSCANTSLTCVGLQTTSSHVSQYRAENGNLRKFGSTFCQGAVLAPKQCLYQTEATGKESPKCIPPVGVKTSLTCARLEMTSSQVSQYRAENENLRKSGATFARVPCLHQSNVYIKRKLRVRRVQKCIPFVGAKTSLTCAGLQMTPSHVSHTVKIMEFPSDF